MSNRNPLQQSPVSVLATDLDGTFLPLNGEQAHIRAMQQLGKFFTQEGRLLIFVTGRHYASVRAVMKEVGAPSPAFIICDVGTSIYQADDSEEGYRALSTYRTHLDALTRRLPLNAFRAGASQLGGLTLQESEKQGAHKLSYYCRADTVDALVAELEALIAEQEAPYSVIGSVDPFNGDGLIDVLPVGVDKAYALAWLGKSVGFEPENAVFSGDSGNDVAALTSGCHAILVGNATGVLKKKVRQKMEASGKSDRLYIAEAESTSGILEGCLRWGVPLGETSLE